MAKKKTPFSAFSRTPHISLDIGPHVCTWGPFSYEKPDAAHSDSLPNGIGWKFKRLKQWIARQIPNKKRAEKNPSRSWG